MKFLLPWQSYTKLQQAWTGTHDSNRNPVWTFIQGEHPSRFFGEVPNFDGLSRENYQVFRDAELSRLLNSVAIFSRFECNVTSHVAADHFDGLIPIPNSLSSDAFFRAQYAPNPFSSGAPPVRPAPRWGAYDAPPDSLVGWGGDTPYPFPSTPSVPRGTIRVSTPGPLYSTPGIGVLWRQSRGPRSRGRGLLTGTDY